jgi:hypothetical protein
MNGWGILGCSIAGGIVGMLVARKYPTLGFIMGGFGTFTILMVAGVWNGSAS